MLQAENLLRDHGDRIPAEVKIDLDTKVAAVKDILEKDPTNADRLRPAYEEMVQALTQVGTAMYAAGRGRGRRAPNGRQRRRAGAPARRSDETVDAEFREVGGQE